MTTATQPTTAASELRGKFLVAMPSLHGTEFESSVIYLLDHTTEEGAFGLIVNHALDMTEGDVIESLHDDIDASNYNEPAFNGGPVEPQRGFIVHTPTDQQRWQGQVNFTPEIAVTTSPDILTAMSEGQQIPHYLVALGYSGWDAGQLEDEIKEDAWLVVDTDPSKVFQVDWHLRLNTCLESIGIRYEQLSAMTGTA